MKRAGDALGRGLTLVRGRSFKLLMLGAATASSLLSVACGVGLLAFPFWLVELARTLLSRATNAGAPELAQVPDTSPARAPAMALVALGTLWVVAVATLALAGLAARGAFAAEPLGSSLLVFGTTALALSPFGHGPLLLLDGHERDLRHACVRSARLALRDGCGAWLAVAVCTGVLIGGPVWLVVVLLRGFGASLSEALALGAAVLAFTLPAGQAVLVADYRSVQSARESPLEASQASVQVVGGRRRLVRLWSWVAAAPLLWGVLHCASLLRPSPLALGSLPGTPLAVLEGGAPEGGALEGGALEGGVEAGEPVRRVLIPRTDIAVTLTGDGQAVVSVSDGGGAGRLPVRGLQGIDRVVITRQPAGFGIQVAQGDIKAHTVVDAAGVRQDDGFPERFRRRVPPPADVALAVLLALSALAAPFVLSGLVAGDPGARGGTRGGAQNGAGAPAWVRVAAGVGWVFAALHGLATAAGLRALLGP